jgi:hypothetical protein
LTDSTFPFVVFPALLFYFWEVMLSLNNISNVVKPFAKNMMFCCINQQFSNFMCLVPPETKKYLDPMENNLKKYTV